MCDVAHQAVFRHGEDGQLSEFVKEYEAKPFKGPSAMLLDSAGNMFFTDSGPMVSLLAFDPRATPDPDPSPNPSPNPNQVDDGVTFTLHEESCVTESGTYPPLQP